MKTINIHKALLALLLIFVMAPSNAQVLLSTSDNGPTEGDPSAALEIYSDNSGLLIPYIVLNFDDGGAIEAPTIPAPADGLIIFHQGSNNITKGLWYYDADIPAWVIYSDFSSTLANQDLDNFGEMSESNEIGNGTLYDLSPDFYTPWHTAQVGLIGSAFQFLDDQLVNTEMGTDTADQFLITGEEAVYSVIISATLAASAPSTTVTGTLYKNDVRIDHIFFRHTFQLKDKPTSLNTSGNIEIIDGDKIDFRFYSDVKNKGIQVENLNIRFTKMGDL